MEQTNPTPITTTTVADALRPTFLTVLCILTFIGSSWGIYKGISGYYSADTAASMVSEIKNKTDDAMEGKEAPTFVKGIMNNVMNSMSADNIRKSSIISAISALLTLTGAILMWGLQKRGFYIYIAGTIVAILAPMIILGGGMMGMMAGGFTAFIGIIFIVMYGVNTKYMIR